MRDRDDPAHERADSVTVSAFFEDERRQGSKDLAFGDEWRSAEDPDAHFHLYWLIATGECFLMRVVPSYRPDFGIVLELALGLWNQLNDHAASNEMRIEILATGVDLDEVRRRLTGWEGAMSEPDGVEWLRRQLAGASPASPYSPPEIDQPSKPPGFHAEMRRRGQLELGKMPRVRGPGSRLTKPIGRPRAKSVHVSLPQ